MSNEPSSKPDRRWGPGQLPRAAGRVRARVARTRQRRKAERRSAQAGLLARLGERRARRAGRPGHARSVRHHRSRLGQRQRPPAGHASAGFHDRFVRGPAALLSRRQHRPAGGSRHDQRPGRRRGDAPVSLGGLHPGRGLSDRRPAPHRRLDARGLPPGRRLAGDRRYESRRSRRGRRSVHHHRRNRAGPSRPPAVDQQRPPGRPDHRFRHGGRSWHRDHVGSRGDRIRNRAGKRHGAAGRPDAGHARRLPDDSSHARSDAGRGFQRAQRIGGRLAGRRAARRVGPADPG